MLLIYVYESGISSTHFFLQYQILLLFKRVHVFTFRNGITTSSFNEIAADDSLLFHDTRYIVFTY